MSKTWHLPLLPLTASLLIVSEQPLLCLRKGGKTQPAVFQGVMEDAGLEQLFFKQSLKLLCVQWLPLECQGAALGLC